MNRFLLTSVLFLVTLLHPQQALSAGVSSKVVAADEIKWGYLNPLRGVLSPGAADLWGDRTANTATGMLVRFKKGFESPPHIHNITYRGVVIDGLLHNDDPAAEKMWMPPGSFWTQPAGENHTTAADGDANLIYLEIDSGPYLVKPSRESFDNGERPLNVHNRNIVWLSSSDLYDIEADGVKVTYLWESAVNVVGSMIKLPVGFEGVIRTDAEEFRAVLIAGIIEYTSRDIHSARDLPAGSFIESTGSFEHKIVNAADTETTIYIRTNREYKVQ